MDTACQFSSLGARCRNCPKCSLADAIAERDAYREALRALVEALPRCVSGSGCTATATRYTTNGDSIAWCDDHGCEPPLKHDDAEYAAPLRAALTMLKDPA